MSYCSDDLLKAIGIKEELVGLFDPIDALKSFTDEPLLLLESADQKTKLGEKSVILADLAVKIEARSNIITATSLLDEAQAIIDRLKQHFRPHVIAMSEHSVSISIDPLHCHLDLMKKMRAKSALDVLRATMSLISLDDPALSKYLMMSGVFAYDFLDHFEKLPTADVDIQELPDYLFYLPLSAVIIDHLRQATDVIAFAIASEDPGVSFRRVQQRSKALTDLVSGFIASSHRSSKSKLPMGPPEAVGEREIKKLNFLVDVADEKFHQLISTCKQYIEKGSVYQIVPSRTFYRPIKHPIACYQALRQLNPSPYMFYVKTSEWTLFGASPETFIKVDQGGARVSVRPIAGTRRRGFNEHGGIDLELDAREQASLCLDDKELSEHMMLVDLARNDVASVSKPGSRVIKRLLGIDRFSHVMHLVSEVEGELAHGFDALSAYQASMNMGTLMGAPKVEAAILLRKLEHSKRGFYGGAVGYIDAKGDMDTAIVIRSALVKDGTAYVRAGCGVVYDSDVVFETEETLNKAEAVLWALELGDGL